MKVKINDSIEITFNELQIKYLSILISQSQQNLSIENKDDIIKNKNEIKLLLDSRKCYVSMYGYQWKDEKEILTELQKIFSLIF